MEYQLPHNSVDTTWDALQDGDDSRVAHLLSALDAGWRIDPPIYARPRWHSSGATQWTYYFVLSRQHDVTLLGVPDSARLRSIMNDLGLKPADILDHRGV